jgi:hypothetical protein
VGYSNEVVVAWVAVWRNFAPEGVVLTRPQ